MVVKFVFRFDTAYNLTNTLSKRPGCPERNNVSIIACNTFSYPATEIGKLISLFLCDWL